MTQLTDFLGGAGGQTSLLRGLSGPSAINVDDLVQLNAAGELVPVRVADYAAVANGGASVIASTQASAYPSAIGGVCRVQPAAVGADGSIFYVDTYKSGNNGLQVWKYSPSGALLATYSLDTGNSYGCGIAVLANGNVAVWGYDFSNGFGIYIAVLDPSLNPVKGLTQIGTAARNPDPSPWIIALSGGGFAVAWTDKPGNTAHLMIYDNSGNQVANTALPGVAAQSSNNSLGLALNMVELSNKNIAVGYSDTYAKTLGFAIFSPTGAQVVGYTQLQAGNGSAVAARCDMAAMAGYFCISSGNYVDSQSPMMAVISNAGVTAGTYNVAASNANLVCATDGASFWGYQSAGGLLINITTAGAVKTYSFAGGGPQMVSDGGVLLMPGAAANSAITAFAPKAGGGFSNVPTSGTIAQAGTAEQATATGDGTILVAYNGYIQLLKYANTAVVGVAQQAVASGNPGTPISYTHGGGLGKNGYSINAVAGTVGKAFDHTATNISGNKGTILGTAVALEGIA